VKSITTGRLGLTTTHLEEHSLCSSPVTPLNRRLLKTATLATALAMLAILLPGAMSVEHASLPPASDSRPAYGIHEPNAPDLGAAWEGLPNPPAPTTESGGVLPSGEPPGLRIDKTVAPTVIFRRSEGTPDTATVTLKVEGRGDPTTGRRRVDVVLVIDRSSSMNWESYSKFPQTKAAAQGFVENLQPDDQSGLASFADAATQDKPLDTNHAATKAAISRLYASGSTAIGSGVYAGQALITSRGRATAHHVMILLSDGYSNAGPNPITAAVSAKSAGTEIFSIGLGSWTDEATLRAVASPPASTHYYNAPTSNELAGIYQRITTQLANVAGVDVVVNDDLGPFLEVVPGSITPPPSRTAGGSSTWNVGTLDMGTTFVATYKIRSWGCGSLPVSDPVPIASTRPTFIGGNGTGSSSATLMRGGSSVTYRDTAGHLVSLPFPRRTITVLCRPMAAFSWAPGTPTEGGDVRFTDLSRDPGGQIVSRVWDFGDGTSATDVRNPRHAFGDNGVFWVTLRVTDNDGLTSVTRRPVTVTNAPPSIDPNVTVWATADVSLRVAGEKWHDVALAIYQGGVLSSLASVTRAPGSPDGQATTVREVPIHLLGPRTSATVVYTPENDPVNGQPWGANPVWIEIDLGGGSVLRMQHMFNVRQGGTYVWTLPNLKDLIDPVGLPLRLHVAASDPGSDDLSFVIDFGNGQSYSETVCNVPDPCPDRYPSPQGSPIRTGVTATQAYEASDRYAMTITVTDDDGGSSQLVVFLDLAPLTRPPAAPAPPR